MKFIILCAFIAFSVCAAENLLSDEFINSINSAQKSWIAGRNFNDKTTIHDLRKLVGAKEPEIDYWSNLKVKVHDVNPEAIPDTFDARDEWSFCETLSDIRNQGACGSCWAFGAAEAITDRICIHSKGEKKVRISSQDIVECCDVCGDCGGGYGSRAWDFWVSNGVVSGGDYKSNEGCKPTSEAMFNGNNVACSQKCNNNGFTTAYNNDKHFGKEHYSIAQNVQQIQTEIKENGPVEAWFQVYDDFYNYKSGVYQYTTGNYVGNHLVKIIGWGTENNQAYWLIANSWGYDWGQGGFFKILRGANHVGIESYIDGGIPKL